MITSSRLLAIVLIGISIAIIVLTLGQQAELPGESAASDETAARLESTSAELRPDSAQKRSIDEGEVHSYRFSLDAGYYARVVVEQLGIDITMTLFSSDGERLIQVDSPTGPTGGESISCFTPVPATYILEVSPGEKPAQPGAYEARIDVLRPATETDRIFVEAERLFYGAKDLEKQRTSQSDREAVAEYERGLKLWEKVGDRRWQGQTLKRLGSLQFKSGATTRALDSYRRALALFQEVSDPRNEAVIYNSLGPIYRRLGKPEAALECYEKSLKIGRDIGSAAIERTALTNSAPIHASRGEAQRALDVYYRLLAWFQAEKDLSMEAFTYNNIGSVYLSAGEYPFALDAFEKALDRAEAAGILREEARTLDNFGRAYRQKGDYTQALIYSNRALALWKKSGDVRREAIALNSLGLTHHLAKEMTKARELYDKALNIFEDISSRRDEAIVSINLARLCEASGDPREALSFARQALSICQEMEDRSCWTSALFALARAEASAGRIAEAAERTERALVFVELLRGGLGQRSLRSSFHASKQDYYSFYIDLLMQLNGANPSAGYDAKALHVSERSRARSLLDSLAEAKIKNRQHPDPETLDRQRELQEEINAMHYEMLRRGGDLADRSDPEIARRLRGLIVQYERLQTNILQRDSHKSSMARIKPIGFSEIQKTLLNEDTQLLVYSLGEERSYVWLLSADSMSSHVLPGRVEIEDLARHTYDLMSRSDELNVRGQLELASAALSKLLFQAVAEELCAKRILVVKDGALHYIPFGALPDPGGIEGDRPAGPLISRYEMISLPSASTVAILREDLAGRPPRPGLVAVIADPVFDASDPRVQGVQPEGSGSGAEPAPGPQPVTDLARSARGLGIERFPRLPATQDEAEAILALVPPASGFAALGFAANRDLVFSGELARYRILHFAAHGLLNAEFPELSGVVLSLVDEQGRSRDGFVRAHELFNLDLSADLIVLSACQTALGKEVRGEGLVGLTRGFLYAGAGAVVVSLWSVSDRATAELMKAFYHALLKDRFSPAAALRSAQQSIRRQPGWEPPYYWAGFVLQGEWR